MLHLSEAGQERENLAVDRLLMLPPFVHDRWYRSLGLDPQMHWALVRPRLLGLLPNDKETEIDIVFGSTDPNGAITIDHLVAVEAKCWKKEASDLEQFGQDLKRPKSNLWKQVQRNLHIGFNRVAGVDILSTSPSSDYMSSLDSASQAGTADLNRLRWLASEGRRGLEAGYSVFGFGAVEWKDESDSGSLLNFVCEDAPLHGRDANDAIGKALSPMLSTCPVDYQPPYHFVLSPTGWTRL
jgi:hypothetical protein